MVNEVLVSEGYARVSTYHPDVKFEDLFRSSEAKARDGNAGLWGQCEDASTPGPVDVPQTIEPKESSLGSDCSIHYATVCIPKFPPDLNCGDISFRNFKVLRPDPHRFDKDYDGFGCEN